MSETSPPFTSTVTDGHEPATVSATCASHGASSPQIEPGTSTKCVWFGSSVAALPTSGSPGRHASACGSTPTSGACEPAAARARPTRAIKPASVPPSTIVASVARAARTSASATGASAADPASSIPLAPPIATSVGCGVSTPSSRIAAGRSVSSSGQIASARRPLPSSRTSGCSTGRSYVDRSPVADRSRPKARPVAAVWFSSSRGYGMRTDVPIGLPIQHEIALESLLAVVSAQDDTGHAR